MKKTFDSFSSCLELREVIFLRSLPPHPHLVPALDIFLDPYTRRLHIAMEFMDGNLYQLMKAREHKPMDAHSVKSILFQILSGLEHIHDREFFHRDIKPENILVSTSQQNDTSPFAFKVSRLWISGKVHARVRVSHLSPKSVRHFKHPTLAPGRASTTWIVSV